MEQKSLAREYAYRRKERFQVPLAVGLAALPFLFGDMPAVQHMRRVGAAEFERGWRAVGFGIAGISR